MKATGPTLVALRAAVEVPCPPESTGRWRWIVRQHLGAVRDALAAETTAQDNTWLAARGGALLRERSALLVRVAALGPRVLEDADLDAVRRDLRRLVSDVGHHIQRVHDLAYDEVEFEIGGSE